jgi:non-ribosomal peptide synthetase component F
MPANPLADESIWGLPGAIVGPAMPGAEAFSTTPILDLLRASAARDPDAVALVGQTGSLRYADLLRLAQNVACAVAGLVPPGQTVACLLPRSPEGVAGLLGCLIAGRLCMVLDPDQPAERQAALLADGAPAALMLAAPLPFPFPAPVLMLSDALAGPDREWHADGDWDPDAPFAVYFTSGSSGRPKGIVLSARYVLYRGMEVAESWALGAGDGLFWFTGHIGASGIAAMLVALARGARVLLANVATEGAGGTLRFLEREKVTCADIPAPILRVLFQLERGRSAFRTLRGLRIGSAALARTDLAAWRPLLPAGCTIVHTYASTEAMVMASWLVPDDDTGSEPAVAAGMIRPSHDYALLDEDGRPVGPGEPGELVLRSRYVALGEWQGGRLVPGRMPPVPGRPGWRYFRTGDLLRLQPDGMLRVIGRADRQVKINGIRVEPAEIEAILRAEPAVTDAAVVAKPVAAGMTLHAFVVSAEPGETELIAALRKRLSAALPPALRPSSLTVLERLPMLPGGKIDFVTLSKRV